MAVNVGISVSSWNFGSVLVGTPVTKLIMFVADDGNDATATVNFGGLAAPFSISPSSLSILPGHAKNATITFTPASIASFSDTLTFTGNATLTPSTLPVSGAGAGGIVTNKYTLPAKMTASGLLNAYLFVDDQIPAITVPTGDWLIKAPKFSEKVDVNAGEVDFDNVKIDCIEDYTVYPEGFWNHLINGFSAYLKKGIPTDPVIEIMFSLVENGNETFLFRGTIYREETKAKEYYRNDTNLVRGMSISLVSMLGTLGQVAVADLSNWALDIYSSTDAQDKGMLVGFTMQYCTMVTIRGLFKAMMALAYNVNAVSNPGQLGVYNASNDIMVAPMNDTSTFVNFDILWFAAMYHDEPGIGAGADSAGFFYGPSSYAWQNRFQNARELLKYLCLGFGVVPRYMYCGTSGGQPTGIIDPTPSNNAHWLVLVSRGRNAAITIDGDLIESMHISSTPARAKNINFAYNQDTTKFTAWFNFVRYTVNPAGYPTSAAFDIQSNFDFWGVMSSDGATYAPFTLHTIAEFPDTDTGAINNRVGAIQYWNYQTGAYDFISNTSFVGAAADYYFNRFSNSRVRYTRTYNAITATLGGASSQLNLQILAGHVIDDVFSGIIQSNNYYAAEISTDIETREAMVSWDAQ